MKKNKKLRKILKYHFTINRLVCKNNALIDSLIEKRRKINNLIAFLEKNDFNSLELIIAKVLDDLHKI